MREPCDAAVRERVTERLDQTFLVEAAAGTGKTALLVDRYLACVQSGAPVARIAAITFTEKAAGELRFRIRDDLARRLREAGPEMRDERRRLMATALRDLDDAPISTIHSFSARLLRERPVDLGVDPAFEQLDGFGASLFGERVWQSWAAEVLGDGDEGGVASLVAELLRAGVPLEGLKELADRAFRERYDLDPASAPRTVPDLGPSVGRVRRALGELDAHCHGACREEADRGRLRALELTAAASALDGLVAGDVHQQAAALRALPLSGTPAGRKGNWDGDGKARMLELWGDVRDEVRAALAEYGDYVCRCGLAAAHAHVSFAERAARAAGVLDFGDLLGKLRDALRDRPRVRRGLQAAFDYLLVDEFQDTDPLQAEAIVFLAQDGTRGLGGGEPATWRDARLTPGKLFVVGDPKQSIYRFRRADIGVYQQMADLIRAQPEAASVEVIEQNFRTTPAVAGWVDREVGAAIAGDAAPGRQPGYVELMPWRPDLGEPRVTMLVGEEGESSAETRASEAEAIAALLVDGVDGERWRVRDRKPDGDAGPEPTRRARWSDVAVLLRAFTHADTFERAFQAAGVPFRTEGGREFFQRREVADMLLLLRAVDDPSDLPAVYGTLHSSLFGFSDEELFLHRTGGGTFDVAGADGGGSGDPVRGVGGDDEGSADVPGPDDVTSALAVLRRLHVRRGERTVAGTVGEAIRLTRAAESWTAAGDRGPQAVANLDKLVEMARAFDAEDSATLRGFVRWAGEAAVQADEAESLPPDERDAVRIMSVHAAKGLEFPIVVLAAGGAQGRSQPRRGVLVDRARRSLACAFRVPGAAKSSSSDAWRWLEEVATAGFDERHADEGAHQESEERRLLYVAATRACDRLVVPCFGVPKAHSLLTPLEGRLPPEHADEHVEVLAAPAAVAAPRPSRSQQVDAAVLRGERECWRRDRRRLLVAASRPLAVTSPSSLEELAEEEPPVVGSPRETGARERALAVGTAVHAVMERVSFDEEERAAIVAEVKRLACASAADVGHEGLAERIADLALACRLSAPVREAAAAAAAYREMPFCIQLEGTLLEGYCDLVYRSADGWVVVDYKTDADPDEETIRRRYGPQGGAYALAVRQVTGAPVTRVSFVLAAAAGPGRPAPSVDLAVTPELLDGVLRAAALSAANPCGYERAEPPAGGG